MSLNVIWAKLNYKPMRSAVSSSSVRDLRGVHRDLLPILWLTLHLTRAFLSWSLRICCLADLLRILAFNCKICVALEALEALVTVKMLPFSPQGQRIDRPHRRFHRILLLAHNASTTVVGNAAQPSPEFLAAVVQTVKALLPAEQASVSGPDPSRNSSVLDQATNSSSSAMLGGIPDQDLSSQASALWTAGTGFSTHSSLAQVSSSQGRPALVVPSFVRTFATPNPLLVSSCAITASPVASQADLAINSVFPSVSAPILHQPFVVGLEFSPIPAKLVGQIVAGKFVELNDLLSSNIVLNLSHNCYSMAA